MQILEKLNFINDLYIVGGYVRDTILGIESNDIDLTSPTPPLEFIELCEKNGYRTIPTGIAHGTVTVVVDYKSYEHTTFRKDVSTDGRNATVEFSKNIIDDLSRRDFTINAMALGRDSKLIDPFRGEEHLKDNILTAVGTADKRLKEDYLRVIRAARFAAKFGMNIDVLLYKAMENNSAQVLDNVSIERVVMEFEKVFSYSAPAPSIFLRILKNIGILYLIFPELQGAENLKQNLKHHPEGDVLTHILQVVDRAPSNIRWHALLHDIGKPCTAKLKEGEDFYSFIGHEVAGAEICNKVSARMRFSSRLKDELYTATLLHMYPTFIEKSKKSSKVRQFQKEAGIYLDIIKQLVTADVCDRREIPTFAFSDQGTVKRIILGRDIMERYPIVTPGVLLGELVDYIYEFQLNNGVFDKQKLLHSLGHKIKKYFPEYNAYIRMKVFKLEDLPEEVQEKITFQFSLSNIPTYIIYSFNEIPEEDKILEYYFYNSGVSPKEKILILRP